MTPAPAPDAAALAPLFAAYGRAKRDTAEAAARLTREDCADYARARAAGAALSPAALAFERAQQAERDARDALTVAFAELAEAA